MPIISLLRSNTPDALGAPNIIKPDDSNPVANRAPDWSNAPNVIKPDADEQCTHRYNLCSQANCVLDTTTPLSVLKDVSGNLLKYCHLIKRPDAAIWTQSLANDFGRLAQGLVIRMPKGTNTFFFIPHHQVPKNRQVSYVKPVAKIRPNKAEVNRVRLTAGDDKLNYPGITATDVTSLTTTKVHLNSIVYTPGAKYMTADIQNFYYGTPLDRFEYLIVQLTMVPEEIQH